MEILRIKDYLGNFIDYYFIHRILIPVEDFTQIDYIARSFETNVLLFLLTCFIRLYSMSDHGTINITARFVRQLV